MKYRTRLIHLVPLLMVTLFLSASVAYGQRGNVSELRQNEQQLETALASLEDLMQKARSNDYILRPMDLISSSRAVPIAMRVEDFEGQIAVALVNRMITSAGADELRRNAAAYTFQQRTILPGQVQELRQRLQDTRNALAQLLTNAGARTTANAGRNRRERSGVDEEEEAAEQTDQRDRNPQNEETPSGPSQGEMPNITGIWSVKWTDPYAYYTFRWVIRRDGAGWQISQTLLDTNHGYNRRLIGTTWDDTTLEEAGSGKLELRRTSNDANPGNPGYFQQTATCAFSEGSFSCKGTHKGTQITHWISIDGNKGERRLKSAPKN